MRAILSEELAKLRADGQFSKLYLAIHEPVTVFSARVNQTFSSVDNVTQVTYDGGVGTIADVLAGMTLWVGSASGGRDLGECRIRKAGDATTLYIGATSDIAWADNLYLTVVDEFGLWAKRAVLTGDFDYLMDEDIAYSNQHEVRDPVVVMGAPAAGFTSPSADTEVNPYRPDWTGAVYSGNWYGYYWAGFTYDDTGWRSDYVGESVSIRFYGTQFAVVYWAYTGGTRGKFSVYIDGAFIEEVDCSTSAGLETWTSAAMTAGWHTVQLVHSALPSIFIDRYILTESIWTLDIAWDASESHAPGSSVSSYAWSAPGALTTSGSGATFTSRYRTAGTYRVQCTVTAANGASSTGTRFVFVYDSTHPPVTDFEVNTIAGNRDDGGWYADLRLHQSATVREGALCVLFAEDWYGTSAGSLGPVSGRENVLMWGWMHTGGVELSADGGRAKMRIEGPAARMERLGQQPVWIRDFYSVEGDDGGGVRWTRFTNLKIDDYIWHLLHWRSTADAIFDVILSGDTRVVESLSENGTLAEKVKNVCQKILAEPICDRYGRLYISLQAQYLESADRASLPVVMDITTADWSRLDINEANDPISAIEAEATQYDGGIHQVMASRAAGETLKRCGPVETESNLVVSDQTQLNQLSGHLLARKNGVHGPVSAQLEENNRFVDIAPAGYVRISLAAGDTPAGSVWSNQKCLVQRVEFVFDPDCGNLSTALELEAETIGVPGVTIDPPQEDLPLETGIDLPELDDFPMWPGYPGDGGTEPYIPEDYPELGVCKTDPTAAGNGPYRVWIVGEATSTDRYSRVGPFACWVRADEADNPTRYSIHGRFLTRDTSGTSIGGWTETMDDDWYEVYGLDASNNRVAHAVKDAVTIAGLRTGVLVSDGGAGVDIVRLEIAVTAEDFDCTAVADAGQYIGKWRDHTTPGTFGYALAGNYAYGTIANATYGTNGADEDWLDASFAIDFTFSERAALFRWYDVKMLLHTNSDDWPDQSSPDSAYHYWRFKLTGAAVDYWGDGAIPLGNGNHLNPDGSKKSDELSLIWPMQRGFQQNMKFYSYNEADRTIKLEALTTGAVRYLPPWMTLQVWVRPIASKKIVFNSVQLWNVCAS